MKNCLLLGLSCLLIWPSLLLAQSKSQYFDGPYVFHQNDSLRVQWVERGMAYDTLIAKADAGIFRRDSLPVVDLQNLDFKVDRAIGYEGIEKVVALSDVHGQFGILRQLLRAQKVVDEEDHWNMGKGHLVVVGDNLDRGEQVLEILWFLFFLQKEAEAAGGKVQVLLGNHEILVLKGDIRYLARKYYVTSGLFVTPYSQFFRKGSVLGDWLASHRVITTIDRRLFVHGGMSSTALDLEYPIEKINDIFSYQVLPHHDSMIVSEKAMNILYGEVGPVWYRGYFNIREVDQDTIDRILNRLEMETLIVGHTSLSSIQALFNHKVIGIDCNIKVGKTGQVLIIENDEYSIGHMDGSRTKIPPAPKRTAFFDYIYQLPGRPKIKMTTEVKRLIKQKRKEIYQSTSFQLEEPQSARVWQIEGRIRARGNTRKKVCFLPPVKVDFGKSTLDSLGFLTLDKLKFVFPCKDKANHHQHLYKEFLLYELYQAIDTNAIRAKLVDLVLANEKETKYDMMAFLVEDEKAYAHRKKARIIDRGKINPSRLERLPFLKMLFFQYMIANTDWSLRNRHNLELVKLPELDRVTALPYDFDYSGFVGQLYAVPHESLPIEEVNQRYFMKYSITEKEFYQMVDYYQSIEAKLYQICDEATYMSEKSIESAKAYIESFYKLLEKPDRLLPEIVRD